MRYHPPNLQEFVMRSFLLLALVLPLSAQAATVNVNLTGGAAVDLAAALGIDPAQIEQQLEREIAAAFNTENPEEYVRALADAQAFSNSGLGVDYASNPTLFSAGLSAKVAASSGDEGLGEYYEERPVAGVAPNISVMAGLNMDFIGLDWLTLYGNYFAQTHTVEELDGSLQNFGFHAQVKFFRPPESEGADYIFQWGGLDLTTGYEWSRMRLTLSQKLDTPMPLSGSGIDTEAVFGGLGTFTITTTASNVPVELTTNFRLFYVATIFLGAGYDFHFGDGEMEVDLTGDIVADNPSDNSEVNLGSAEVEVNQTGKPSDGVFRLILGLQANISVVKVFVQANIAPNIQNGATAVAAGAGVRVAW
jgi:hypothetical protein